MVLNSVAVNYWKNSESLKLIGLIGFLVVSESIGWAAVEMEEWR